jgi:hypothetical protein
MRYILFQGAWSDCLFVQGCGRTRRFFLNDFIKYMCIHLSSGQTPEDIRIYPKTTMVLFSTKVTGLLYNNTRAFGWDTILVQTYPPYGHKFSVNSFGHIDFIGTSIRAGKDIVLLNNREYPTSLSNKHIKVRSDVSDAVIDAMICGCIHRL